jgi:endoglucanase
MSLLEELVKIDSPSGYEREIATFIIKNLSLKNFKPKLTPNNTLCFTYNNNYDKTILLDAHLDIVHLKVAKINSDGTIIAKPIGFNGDLYRGNDLEIIGKQTINAYYINPAPHLGIDESRALMGGCKNHTKVNKNILLETGLPYNELINIVSIGDPIVYKERYYEKNDRIFARGLDNKVGVYTLMKVLEKLDQKIAVVGCNIIVNFSSNEEVGLSNLGHLSNEKIDFIIALDADNASDTINSKKDDLVEIQIGKGVTITKNAEDSREFTEWIIGICEKNSIDYQLVYSDGYGLSNMGLYSLQNNVYSKFIGIPIRNMHSPLETCDKKDIESAIKLLETIVISLPSFN